MDFYVRFGELVRRRRTEMGLSQEILAEMSGLSRGTILNLEAGKFAAQLKNALDVAKIIGINLEEIDKLRTEVLFETELGSYPPEIKGIMKDKTEGTDEASS